MQFQDATLYDTLAFANSAYSIDSGVNEVDSLLNRGSVPSMMMWMISLMPIALGFGRALERTGCLETIVQSIDARVHSFAGVQSSAIGTSVATNLVAGDPYPSIALPGRMYPPVYRGMGYSTLNLSRATEEGGILISPLIPWNAGGAFVISALGLGVAEGNFENLLYIPLAFACSMTRVIGIFYGITGLFSPRATPEVMQGWRDANEPVMDLAEHGFEDPMRDLDAVPAQ